MGFYPSEGDVDSNGAEEVNLRSAAGAELLGQQTSAASLPVVLASNQSPIPVVNAGGYYNSFAVVGERTAIGTTELPVLLFRNPTGSTKTVRPKQFMFTNRHTVSSFIIYRIYASPTVTTTGTTLTEVSTNIGAGVTPSADSFSSPTISANGTLIGTVIVGGGVAPHTVILPLTNSFTMAANTAILVTATADGTSRIATVSLFWEE